MAKLSGLEERLKNYEFAVGLGQATGLAATVAGITNIDKIAGYFGFEQLLNKSYNVFGYNIAPGLPILGAGLNFLGDQIGFAASLYAFNRGNYKGISGKFRFINDFARLGVRHLGSYAITYPLAIAASTALISTGLLTGGIAIIAPYVLESVITGVGYILSTLGIRKKSSDTASKPSYGAVPSPQPA